jgi:hypothetical protein
LSFGIFAFGFKLCGIEGDNNGRSWMQITGKKP